MYWLLKSFKRTFTYKGRARRKEYAYFLLLSIASYFYAGIFTWTLIDLFGNYAYLSFILPYIALSFTMSALISRRLQDMGISGKIAVVSFFPFLFLFLAPLLLMKGDSTPNKYGHHPKGKRKTK